MHTKQHHTVIIEGIEVKFPFEPYSAQVKYMEKVIKTLNKKKTHALLESPTGTGKTLSLLCATFAWLVHNRGNPSKKVKKGMYKYKK